MGEIAGHDIGAIGEPDRSERRSRGAAQRRIATRIMPETKARSAVSLNGEGDVVEHGELAEDARHLERARQPEP